MGCPVVGSMATRLLCEKSPARSARVGTLATSVCAGRHPRALVIGEEERPVPDQRPAQRAAELVALVLWRGLIGRREEVVSIERAVAEELVSRAVELVAAGACDHADLSARVSAEACVVGGSRRLRTRGWRPRAASR